LAKTVGDIQLPESEQLKYIRSLGAGKAARVQLVKDSKGRLIAEKHFTRGSSMTRWLYKLSFQAPLPYKNNVHAVATAYYTRQIVRDLTEFWFGTPRVAEAKYIRWDEQNECWVLGTEFIKGRGPDPNQRGTKFEIFDLTSYMDDLMDHLYESGLYGPMWQADKGLSVPTSNFLLNDRGEWIWVDIESAVPALRLLRNRPYLREARKAGFVPLFSDIDFGKLDKYIKKNRSKLSKFASLQKNIKKLKFHMREWKESELALFRNSKTRFFKEDKVRAKVVDQSVSTWKREYTISKKTETRVRRSFTLFLLFLLFADTACLVSSKKFHAQWIENKFKKLEQKDRIPRGYRKKLFGNLILSKLVFKELQYWLCTPEIRKNYKQFGDFYIEQKVKEWDRMGRLTPKERKELYQGIKESSPYIKGFGYHLFLKPFSIYFNTISISGVIITGSWEPLLIMLIMPLLRTIATVILWIQERIKGNKIRLGTAFAVGAMTKVGILAYPAQMFHRQREIFRLITNNMASGTATRVPVFGEVNSTIEHWFIRHNPFRSRKRKVAKTKYLKKTKNPHVHLSN
jgi:hypothetical protein